MNGTFTEPQRRVYQWVLDAQLAAIDEARAGRPYAAMHEAAVRVLTTGLVDLGLLEGDVDELIEKSIPQVLHARDRTLARTRCPRRRRLLRRW